MHQELNLEETFRSLTNSPFEDIKASNGESTQHIESLTRQMSSLSYAHMTRSGDQK